MLEGYQQGRYQGMTEFATNLKQDRLLRRGMTVERAAAVMSAHIDVTNWNTLVVRHGFTKKEFERWLVDVSAAALLRKYEALSDPSGRADQAGDDRRRQPDQRQPAAGVRRPADEEQPRHRRGVGRPQERSPGAVGRRAVDRAAGGAGGRSRSAGVRTSRHSTRSRTSSPRSGQHVEHRSAYVDASPGASQSTAPGPRAVAGCVDQHEPRLRVVVRPQRRVVGRADVDRGVRRPAARPGRTPRRTRRRSRPRPGTARCGAPARACGRAAPAAARSRTATASRDAAGGGPGRRSTGAAGRRTRCVASAFATTTSASIRSPSASTTPAARPPSTHDRHDVGSRCARARRAAPPARARPRRAGAGRRGRTRRRRSARRTARRTAPPEPAAGRSRCRSRSGRGTSAAAGRAGSLRPSPRSVCHGATVRTSDVRRARRSRSRPPPERRLEERLAGHLPHLVRPVEQAVPVGAGARRRASRPARRRSRAREALGTSSQVTSWPSTAGTGSALPGRPGPGRRLSSSGVPVLMNRSR